MAKTNEIEYVQEIARINAVPIADVNRFLLDKPFSVADRHTYLMDVAQIMALLPPAPKRLLDVGVGSGWTSEMFAKAGYQVLGIDINSDMIELAKQRNCRADFMVMDYETGTIPGQFDAAVIYDALHHADSEHLVIKNVYNALSDDGVFITAEPGVGHSKTEDSLQAMAKYGTTEKDMPYHHQRRLMLDAGFQSVDQYVRLSQTPLENIANLEGGLAHVRLGFTLAYGAASGHTSIVVARKRGAAKADPRPVAENILSLSVSYDQFVQRLGRR